MTERDLGQQHPGYWPSPWPVECGGNRRQKHVAGRLDAARSTPTVTTSSNGRWNVMVVRRETNQWYAAGTMAAFEGDPPFGWVRRIDPETLETIADTGPLPCGEHVWCGAVAAHANGSLYNVNGSFLHRLSADCEVMLERELPVDQAHNGLLIMSDGSVVADRHDDVVVIDLSSGELVSRVDVGSPLANGMFLSPGPDRSVFYCSTLTLARITWT